MTQITISEVGPRDGLQSVETILSTEGKLLWFPTDGRETIQGKNMDRHVYAIPFEMSRNHHVH